MESNLAGVELSRSRTVKMPRSSRQFVVRTVKPISAVLSSKRSASKRASSSALLKGMRVRLMGFPPLRIESRSQHDGGIFAAKEKHYKQSRAITNGSVGNFSTIFTSLAMQSQNADRARQVC
jgi:hypothetical protein